MSFAEYQQPDAESVPWLLTAGFARTDSGNAERLVARYRDQIRYCPPRKKWLWWDGRRWAWDQIGHVEQYGKQTVRAIHAEAAHAKDEKEAAAISGHAIASEKRERRTAMQVLAQTEPGIPLLTAQLDADPWLFNVNNGTIDLRTRELRPHDRADMITKLSPVDYLPEARSELWDSFLTDLTGADRDLSSYMQRVIGYALYGRVTEKRFWFFYGPPDAMKSTYLFAVSRVFGDYAVSAAFGTWLVQTNTGGNRGDLVALMGARLVTSVEVRKGARFDEEILKRVTGGDPLVAAAKYEHEVTFDPSFALVLAANDAPSIRDDDAGLWARVQRVPCTHPVPKEKQDRTMAQRLSAPDVRRAILAWAVEGCRAWQRDGLGTCAAVERSNASYRKEMDSVARFFDECCVFEPHCRAPNAEIRDAYETWCKDNGIKHPLSMAEIGRRLAARGCKQASSGHARAWSGMRLARADEGVPTDSTDSTDADLETFSTSTSREKFPEIPSVPSVPSVDDSEPQKPRPKNGPVGGPAKRQTDEKGRASCRWATWFCEHPEELERLAALDPATDRTPANDNGHTRPSGAATTQAHWARWYAAHPDELERDAEADRAAAQ
jgi:putative DNA primase/helicase